MPHEKRHGTVIATVTLYLNDLHIIAKEGLFVPIKD